MKKTAVVLLFLQIFLSSKGQDFKTTEAVYVQKLEFGLKGAVKEVTSYICTVEGGKIPVNTANYTGKITMAFDSLGNVTAINKWWDFGTTDSNERNKAEFLSIFTGKGKEIFFQETSRIGEGEFNEISYKYIWSDNYNYKIVSPENTAYSTSISLDRDYRLIKSVFSNEDVIQLMEELETIYKDNKIQEIKTRITENADGEIRVNYQIQVVQKYDNYGNPTVIYGYKDIDKQKLEEVLYKEYQYY